MTDSLQKKLSPEELLEKLAELEHEQWAHWIQYQQKASLALFQSPEMERWIVQSQTQYSKLTEKEKESDREWAKKVLEIYMEAVCSCASSLDSAVEEMKLPIDKLKNPDEVVSMTKKRWATDFNAELEILRKLIKKELIVGSSKENSKE